MRQRFEPKFAAMRDLRAQLVKRGMETADNGWLLDVARIDTSERFVFDPEGLFPDLYWKLALYGHQLRMAGRFALPYDSCFFQTGPVKQGDEKPEFIFVLAWRDASRIFWRVHSMQSDRQSGYLTKCTMSFDADKERNTEIRCFLDDPSDVRSRPSPERAQAMYTALYAAVGHMRAGGTVRRRVTVEELKDPGIRPSERGRGRPPVELLSFHLLSIDPSLLRVPGHAVPGATHASPRLHLRMGHFRTLSDGHEIEVRPCWVGDASLGRVEKDYFVTRRGPSVVSPDAPALDTSPERPHA